MAKQLLGYGFGFYRYGMRFGVGLVRFRGWAVDLCLFKTTAGGQYPDGYNKHWLTVGWPKRG